VWGIVRRRRRGERRGSSLKSQASFPPSPPSRCMRASDGQERPAGPPGRDACCRSTRVAARTRCSYRDAEAARARRAAGPSRATSDAYGGIFPRPARIQLCMGRSALTQEVGRPRPAGVYTHTESMGSLCQSHETRLCAARASRRPARTRATRARVREALNPTSSPISHE